MVVRSENLRKKKKRIKETGGFPIQMHEAHTSNKVASSHLSPTNLRDYVTALEGRPEEKRNIGWPKATWRRMRIAEDERQAAGW